MFSLILKRLRSIFVAPREKYNIFLSMDFNECKLCYKFFHSHAKACSTSQHLIYKQILSHLISIANSSLPKAVPHVSSRVELH
ncbi:hypothetical protein PUN28_012084 [Cardiocondyla obscurior]|uniref:Uncharacterized protein n=1 Tax=Cardiocondyla obscurior TaxID=286306 RepID=A0AAW2FAI4_9HYME